MLFTCPRTIFHDSDSQLPQSKSLALGGRDEVDRHLRNLARHVRAFCFDACHDAVSRLKSANLCGSWFTKVRRRIVLRASAFEAGQLNQNGDVSIIFGPRIRTNHLEPQLETRSTTASQLPVSSSPCLCSSYSPVVEEPVLF